MPRLRHFYGNRGANGVILITTKRAKGLGKVDVNLQVRQGMYNCGLPFYDTLDANGFMQTFFDGLVAGRLTEGQYASRDLAIDGIRNNFFTYAYQNVYGKPATELFNEAGQFVGSNPLPAIAILTGGMRFQEQVTVRNIQSMHRVPLKNSIYSLLAGYLKENGYMLQTDFERFNGRLNATFQPVSYFKMGLNLAAMYTKQNRGIASQR